jgi:hypothetical protein
MKTNTTRNPQLVHPRTQTIVSIASGLGGNIAFDACFNLGRPPKAPPKHIYRVPPALQIGL